MSPEQARGEHVDERSDVFSVAGVFYFILTGRAPFAAPSLPKVLRAVIHEDPVPLTDADAPEPVRRVLMKGLTKAPEQRYQGCAEMLADLERARRAYEGESHRIAQAGLDRYRKTVALIDERRTLGRALAVADIDATCDDAIALLAGRYPMFAKHADPSSLMAPLDRAVAGSALAALRREHNIELAAVDALRTRAAGAGGPSSAAELGDLTLRRPGGQTPDPDPTIIRSPAVASSGRVPLRARAATLWRRLWPAREEP